MFKENFLNFLLYVAECGSEIIVFKNPIEPSGEDNTT